MNILIAWIILGTLAIGGAFGWLLRTRLSSKDIARASTAEGKVTILEKQVEQVTRERDAAQEHSASQVATIARVTAEKENAIFMRSEAQNIVLDATARADASAATIAELNERSTRLGAELAAERLNLSAKNDELMRQKVWFDEQSEHLKTLFAQSASEILENRGAIFGEQNKEQLRLLLDPFQQQLTEYRARVDALHTTDTEARTRLEAQITSLAQSAVDVGARADALAQAMLGSAKKQGDWGQLQLRILLERAGFVEGKHFKEQVSTSGDDNEGRFADIVLWLPSNEFLVIDAKVSLPSWARYCATREPEEHQAALEDLVTSIRTHYLELARKDYAQLIGKGQSIPFTVMFIPIEEAGIAAFRAAPDMFADAQRRKVTMVTPTTLFAVLHLVTALWNIHDKQANAFKIADEGRLLLKKLGSFVESFLSVGTSIKSALDTFDKARGQMQSGQGNLISIAQRMSELGVEKPIGGKLEKLMIDSVEGDGTIVLSPELIAPLLIESPSE